MSLPPRLYLSHDAELDWLMAHEFGRVDDGNPSKNWHGVDEDLGFLHDSPGGRVVGFKVLRFSEFDPETPELEEIWGDPRFDAPMLGLTNASAGEIVLAARRHFDGRSSVNRVLFSLATSETGEEAVRIWRQCLEAGDSMAHFALGYSLYGLGRHAEAYRHLRHYTEIAPAQAWNWCWYGYVAEAVGELSEARRAYQRAIELEEDSQETDAADRLANLDVPADTPPAAGTSEGARIALWGDELPELGRRRVEALSSRLAAGLTAGAKEKSYAHTDPNEDAIAIGEHDDGVLIVCADGHNGAAAARAAVETCLTRLDPGRPLTQDDLVDLWCAAGEGVAEAATAADQPESRTTLVVAVLRPGALSWAAMGDSFLVVVDGNEVRPLSKRRQHFVGWPMTRDEVAERLHHGTLPLRDGAWVIAASDGLTDFVPDLAESLRSAAGGGAGASRVVERLIDAACAGGAGDNVAVAAARVSGRRPETVPAAPPTRDARVRGCLFGGAVGDALGAPIEFDAIARIRKRLGPRGVTDLIGAPAAITDDTQMTLFTAEGLIRAYVRATLKGTCDPPTVVDHAYARWLATQGGSSGRWDLAKLDGWLITEGRLHSVRAPGSTCLSALRAARMGTVTEPLNDSKGCGGVMRIAPVALCGRAFDGDVFELGCDVAALTHGHPSGHLAAGALSEILRAIVNDDAELAAALDGAEARLRERRGHEEVLAALRRARTLAEGTPPSPEAISTLGEGWVAEEALAIGVYCALTAESFEHGVLAAVNHSGDSDSTGSITGNVLGALHGFDAIPARWAQGIDVAEILDRLCADWNALFLADPPPDLEEDRTWWERYPGW